MFWVITVYFNIRNTLPKFCLFLLGHPVYIYIYTHTHALSLSLSLSNPNIKISTFLLLSTSRSNLPLPICTVIWHPTRVMHSASRHSNPATVLVHNLHIFLQNLPRILPASYRPHSDAHLNTVHPSQFTQYLANHMSRAVRITMPFPSTMCATPPYCIVSCQHTVHCCSCSVTRRLSPVLP